MRYSDYLKLPSSFQNRFMIFSILSIKLYFCTIFPNCYRWHCHISSSYIFAPIWIINWKIHNLKSSIKNNQNNIKIQVNFLILHKYKLEYVNLSHSNFYFFIFIPAASLELSYTNNWRDFFYDQIKRELFISLLSS